MKAKFCQISMEHREQLWVRGRGGWREGERGGGRERGGREGGREGGEGEGGRERGGKGREGGRERGTYHNTFLTGTMDSTTSSKEKLVFRGLILRHQLVMLLKNKTFFNEGDGVSCVLLLAASRATLRS